MFFLVPTAENAKWLLNVMWQMEGVDLHLDVNIGKHLSALARTLTMLTGAPDTAIPQSSYDSDDDDDHTDHSSSQVWKVLLCLMSSPIKSYCDKVDYR